MKLNKLNTNYKVKKKLQIIKIIKIIKYQNYTNEIKIELNTNDYIPL
jgi:hypothetical protein